MEKGDIVTIYNYSIGDKRAIKEGKAKLIEFISKNEIDGTERWYVRFEGDEFSVPRRIPNTTTYI